MASTVSLINFRFVVTNFLNEALNGIVLIGYTGMLGDEFELHQSTDRFLFDYQSNDPKSFITLIIVIN